MTITATAIATAIAIAISNSSTSIVMVVKGIATRISTLRRGVELSLRVGPFQVCKYSQRVLLWVDQTFSVTYYDDKQFWLRHKVGGSRW